MKLSKLNDKSPRKASIMELMFASTVRIIYGVAVSKYPGAGVVRVSSMGVESCGGS